MKTTPVLLDRLNSALKAYGVTLRRTELLQVAASAFGLRNVHELSALDDRGGMSPMPARCLGTHDVLHVGEMAFFEDPEGDVFAVATARLDRSEGRGANWILSPFGGLLDVSSARREGATDESGGKAPVVSDDPVLLTDTDCSPVLDRLASLDAIGISYGTFENDFHPLTEREAAYVDPDLTTMSRDLRHQARLGCSALYRGAKHLSPTVEFRWSENYETTQDEAYAEAVLYADAIRPLVTASGGGVHVEREGVDANGDEAVNVRILMPMADVIAAGPPELWRERLSILMTDPASGR